MPERVGGGGGLTNGAVGSRPTRMLTTRGYVGLQGGLDRGDLRARLARAARRSRSCARASAERCTRACASSAPSSRATQTGRPRTATFTTPAPRGRRATMSLCSVCSRTARRGSRSTVTPRAVSAPTSVLLLRSSSTRCVHPRCL